MSGCHFARDFWSCLGVGGRWATVSEPLLPPRPDKISLLGHVGCNARPVGRSLGQVGCKARPGWMKSRSRWASSRSRWRRLERKEHAAGGHREPKYGKW